EEELALIDELGLAGFFLLHWEVLELAREVALEVRGPGSMQHVLPPGRGRGSSVGSLVCYLTGLSHVDPVANDLSLGRFLNRDLVPSPRRARPPPAGRDGGPADGPVGQGFLRRRRLPQDRPARAGDACGGRGVRRPDRAQSRRADRSLSREARRPRRIR